MRVLIIICVTLLGHMLVAQEDLGKMTNVKIWKLLHEEMREVQGQMGNWQFIYEEYPMMLITDAGANRMRIMTPVIEESQLNEVHYKLMLEANFDRALDAKYAIYNTIVWSVFTHPLEELKIEQLKDAISQVAELSKTFGTTYTSTDMVFGGGN